MSKWSELCVLAESRPKVPIYVADNSDGEVSNYLVMARTKSDEKAMTQKSPKKKCSVSKYPFKFFENNHNTKSLDGKFQRKLQTAKSRTEHTVTTETGKNNTPKIYFGPDYISERKKTERAPKMGDTITPKDRHCLKGVEGKYIQWNEILRDALNGKLKMIKLIGKRQNSK